MIMFDISSS